MKADAIREKKIKHKNSVTKTRRLQIQEYVNNYEKTQIKPRHRLSTMP